MASSISDIMTLLEVRYNFGGGGAGEGKVHTVARPPPTQNVTAQESRSTYMPQMGFEPLTRSQCLSKLDSRPR
jgi:hypothetical protein